VGVIRQITNFFDWLVGKPPYYQEYLRESPGGFEPRKYAEWVKENNEGGSCAVCNKSIQRDGKERCGRCRSLEYPTEETK